MVRIGTTEARITRLGANGSLRFLVHLPPEVELSDNERLLSPTQLQIARRAAAGATLKEIASALGRSPETIRSHLREVYRRLAVSSRIELAEVLASRTGSTNPPIG